MTEAATIQEAAIAAVLRAYEQTNRANKAIAALPDFAQSDGYIAWREAVRQTCEAARGYVDACGANGPDDRVWSGSTPPRELWNAALATRDPGFWNQLRAWDDANAQALAGVINGPAGPDPADRILAACDRAHEFLADKNHDVLLEAADRFTGPRPITVESAITARGGRITSITFGPVGGEGASPHAPRRKPQWWANRRARRERARRDRPIFQWSRQHLLHNENPHDGGLALALAGWIQVAEPDSALIQSWYACYFLTAVMRALGYQTAMSAVDVEFRNSSPSPLAAWGRPASDPFSPPNAVVLLPETGRLLDPLAGHAYFDSAREPILLRTGPEPGVGSTFTVPGETSQLTYRLSPQLPEETPHHLTACAAIDDLVHHNISAPIWDEFRAQTTI